MKSVAAIGIVILGSVSALAFAQDALVGTYNGGYALTSGGREQQVGVTLVIASVDNGVVKGTATNQGIAGSKRGGACRGDFPMEGKSDGGKLTLRSTESGSKVGDCNLSLNLAVEGNKLVGTTGAGYKVELSK